MKTTKIDSQDVQHLPPVAGSRPSDIIVEPNNPIAERYCRKIGLL